MNYYEAYCEREKLIEKADVITESYLYLAYELLNESDDFLNTSSIVHTSIGHGGICFEFWVNSDDYSCGRDSFFVSKEVLDNNILKFIRKTKLNKISNINKK